MSQFKGEREREEEDEMKRSGGRGERDRGSRDESLEQGQGYVGEEDIPTW